LFCALVDRLVHHAEGLRLGAEFARDGASRGVTHLSDAMHATLAKVSPFLQDWVDRPAPPALVN